MIWLPYVLSAALISAAALTAEPDRRAPSYAKQVRPFLARYCFECHSSAEAKSDLDMETLNGLLRGGKRGPAIVPGKPNESRLVLLAEGKGKPAMPPKKAKQPKPTEVGLLRAWVAAGAKDDSTVAVATLPGIKPVARRPAPITAVAYQAGGKLLAAGAHKQVFLIDPTNGGVIDRLDHHHGKVTGLAFSFDGQRLAVADSSAGVRGDVLLYSVSRGMRERSPERILAGHKDVILDLAFSPDNKILATAGYDRVIKLWDVAKGTELRTLKDHSDAVYGLTFSPDGRLLASAAADRAVKVWDVASGRRLYTLGESTDWVYGVSWSPDGRHLAAAGIDKSVRVWEVSAQGGKLVHSVFAHEAAITRVAYSPDGKTLYTLGEDRVLKAWEASQLVERKVYTRQQEAVLCVALCADRKQLALGRYDGSLLLIEEDTGKILATPLPIKPQLTKLLPSSGQRGQTIRITFSGKYLDRANEIISTTPDLSWKIASASRGGSSVVAEITFPPNTPAGVYNLAISTSDGQTGPLPFIVDLYSPIAEKEPNDSPTTGQRVSPPVSIIGTIDRAGGVDYYKFEARAGQQLGVQALTSVVGSKLEPVLQLVDMTDRVVAQSNNGLLGYAFEKAGLYALGIRDREYRGGAEMSYRLHIGDIPVVTDVFPLGLQRGTESEIEVDGVNLGKLKSVRVKAPADAGIGSRLAITVMAPSGPALGNPGVLVGEFPEVLGADSGSHPATRASAPYSVIPVPGTANGRIPHAQATDTWRFTARKDRRLVVEVNANRLGSPLDSFLEILDRKGQPVGRATLRCLAKTYVTFRDHDSVGGNIRVESWNELAINDYVWMGSELLRIEALPKNPDDDCHFVTVGGHRIGFLETTPRHVSMGVPIYKVTIHPPGTTFSPNGFPVIELPYQNDDGGPGYGKDSRLFFDPPADGDYFVRVGDSRGQGGANYSYRLTIREPRPSFKVRFSPTSPAVWRGGAVPILVSAERVDGFEGPIELHLQNLPDGLSAPQTTIPAGEYTTTFALWADADAKLPAKPPLLKLVGKASIEGHEVVREVAGGLPMLREAGDIVTTTEQSEITVHPGQQVHLTAKIERRNGFKGRVPVDVRGLPHGVRVLDIGLNGILITEEGASRTFTIYAEPWVKPTTHPFVVLAQHEGKHTEHAAKSVLLRVSSK
jgi:hypothetical protein